MSVTTHTICFSVTGEAMTKMARVFLLDDEPGRAFRLIADGLIGDGATEAAIRILRGESDLVGDSNVGLSLVAARKCKALTSFKKDARYIYAGRFKQHGVWLRPVAWLANLCADDAHWATERARSGSPEWHRARAQFYARDGEVEHLDVPGEGRVWVLFERCSERPNWDRPPLNAREALDEAVEAGRSLRRLEPTSPEPQTLRDRMDAEDDEIERVREQERRAREQERRDQEDERREAELAARIKKIGEDVRARAGTDTFELVLADGRKFTVPRAPFVRWAFHRTDLINTAPAWENVASSGMKMALDNPDHTDWVLGAGIDLQDSYQTAVKEAAWDAAMHLQSEARDARESRRPFAGIFAAIEQLRGARHEAAVIIDEGECTGVVGQDIAVLPDSRADRVKDVEGCRGIIVEQGGPLAHLSIVSRGRGVSVMRHPEACRLFEPGMTVSLNPSAGRITVIEDG